MVEEPVDYDCCTPDQRDALLDALTARSSAIHAELLRVVAAADRSQDFTGDGALSMADWLAYRYQLSPRTARQWVRAARAFEEMPLLQAQYAAGHIAFEALMHALSFAAPEDDAKLADLLPSLGYASAEAMAQQRRIVRSRERDEARRRTQLRLRPDRSGLGSRLSGFVPTEDAAYIEAALTRRADAAGPDPDTGLWSPHETRMADALRDLCAEDLSAAAATASAPDASVVVVHTPAAAVGCDAEARDPEAGSATVDGSPIDSDALHRLLCDTKIEFSIDDPGGRTVGIGRAGRTVPRWLRRRVLARDHGCCRWPGCARPIRHLHHMRHWSRGGPTNASNLMGMCWHHHHLLHEGGWTASGDADGEIVLSGPLGRTIRARAGPIAA